MNDPAFIQHCLELLSPLGATRARRMFGGHALYVDDLCVSLVIHDVFYLKVDDAHRAEFEAARGRPFTYDTKEGERHSLSYYTVPEEAMESPHEMTPWARKALAAAVAARARAPRKKAAKATPARPAAKRAAAKAPAKVTARTSKAAAKAPAKRPPKAAAKKAPAPARRAAKP